MADQSVEDGAAVSRYITDFRAARDRLRNYIARTFPSRTAVWVKSSRYDGPGVVELDSECPPDCLAVRLPNGNLWFYPLEACRPQVPATMPAVAPAEVMKQFGDEAPSDPVTDPTISVSRQTGMLGIFDGFILIRGFRPFQDEDAAVEQAREWLKTFCELPAKVVYPNVTKLKVN